MAHAQLLSHVWLFVTPWTVALQAPLSTEFSRQENSIGILTRIPTGVGSYFLLRGIFQIQGWNPCLLHYRWILHHLGWKSLSHVWLFVTQWIAAHQAPLSMEFSRQEYCSGLPFPSLGDLLDPGIDPRVSCISGRFFMVWIMREALNNCGMEGKLICLPSPVRSHLSS